MRWRLRDAGDVVALAVLDCVPNAPEPEAIQPVNSTSTRRVARIVPVKPVAPFVDSAILSA